MNDDEELQRELTRIALTTLEGHSFALAGSGAIREHGLVDRLTHDVDLFTNDLDPAAFESAVDELVGGLHRAGFSVEAVRRAPQFAQLRVTTLEGRTVEMDLAVDWREREPVTLEIGAVLSIEDAVGSKVGALYSRAEARDYIDVDAIRASGRFSDSELLTAAAGRDDGFDVQTFTGQLFQVQRIAPDRFAEYGVDPHEVAALQERFTTWGGALRDQAQAEHVKQGLGSTNINSPLRDSEPSQDTPGSPAASARTKHLHRFPELHDVGVTTGLAARFPELAKDEQSPDPDEPQLD